jgi:hypothetical protein
MLPDWIKTDRGFWIDPRQGTYPVAEIVGLCWAALTTCMACGHAKLWPVAELTAAFPPHARMSDIALRLKCAACGSDQGKVEFRNDAGALRQKSLDNYAARFGQAAAQLTQPPTKRPPEAR